MRIGALKASFDDDEEATYVLWANTPSPLFCVKVIVGLVDVVLMLVAP